jgi:hypothetical protein
MYFPLRCTTKVGRVGIAIPTLVDQRRKDRAASRAREEKLKDGADRTTLITEKTEIWYR